MRLAFFSPRVRLSTLTNYLMKRGYCSKPDISLPRGGACLSDAHSFERSGIGNNSDIYLVDSGKPGIHLLPVRQNRHSDKQFQSVPHVQISVDLMTELQFRSVYPWTRVKRTHSGGQRAAWHLSIDNSGTVTATFDDETYFGHPRWDMIQRDLARPNDISPCQCVLGSFLTPDTSVVLSRRDIYDNYKLKFHSYITVSTPEYRGYLLSVLKHQLGLKEGMANGFAVHFDKVIDEVSPEEKATATHGDDDDIAISFIPQDKIDKITELKIKPRPAAIGRVWMVCGAVKTNASFGPWAAWYGKRLNTVQALQEKNWARIIGLDTHKLGNKDSFRAIEWNVVRVPEKCLVNKH